MTAPVRQCQPKGIPLRELVATELIAHGEFSSTGNSYPNALLAADEVIKIVLAHTTNAVLRPRAADMLRMMLASSCFGREVCPTLPCACAETLAALPRSSDPAREIS